MKHIIVIIASILGLSILSSQLHAQVLENTPPLDNFYVKVNNIGKKPKPYVNVRDADVILSQRVWRMIDFREKQNQYFYYPIQPVQDRVSLMSMILEGLKGGAIVAYDPFTDDFRKQMTYEEFVAANTSERTTEVENFETGEMESKTVTSSVASDNVKMLRVKEVWFIDKQRSVRDIRILGLCPVIQVYDDITNEFKGVKSLFWLYYSDCRDLFVNTESFNRHNSAMRLSYDDVFAWKRFFSSYITKMDNQQDRQIQEYATNQQVMLEAERMKEYLFLLEHDLWEY